MNKMATLSIMAQFQYGYTNWQKGRFVKVYDKFSSNIKKIDQNISFIETYGQNEFYSIYWLSLV